MNKFEIDLDFGLLNEIQCIEYINKYFKTDIQKTNKFDIFDFYDEYNNFYELKSRRNNYNEYPTTMIGNNKLQYIQKNPNNNYYFIFWFFDGLYYIKYNKEQFEKYEIKIGGRYDRGKKEISNYVYIPIQDLKKII